MLKWISLRNCPRWRTLLVCVDRFLSLPDAGVQLTALKQILSSYEQGKFVQEGSWAIIMPAG